MKDFNFGNRLFELRKKAGLSQGQLAEKVGLSNKAVSKWKKKKTRITGLLLLKLDISRMLLSFGCATISVTGRFY